MENIDNSVSSVVNYFDDTVFHASPTATAAVLDDTTDTICPITMIHGFKDNDDNMKKNKVDLLMLDGVTLNDIILDTTSEIPEVASVKGYKVKEITQLGYRNLAKQLKVPWKNKAKKEIFAGIATKKINMDIYDNLQDMNENSINNNLKETDIIDSDDD